ncbi:MAG: glycosyltransferase family 39 protein [Candidatus Omnitrophota bacterium]
MNSPRAPEKTRAISERPFFVLFVLFAFSLLIAMPLLSLGYGITWDEWMQGHYGKLILRFMLTGGANHDFMEFAETTYLYQGLFDTLTTGFYSLFSGNPFKTIFSGLFETIQMHSKQDVFSSGFYEIRHIFNSLFGLLAMLFAGLYAKRLGSWRTALIALGLITFSPRFFADSMNNPKDIPFAAGYMLALYLIAGFIDELPKPRWRTAIALAVGIAMALGVRVLGLILFFYLLLFSSIKLGVLIKNRISPIPYRKIAGMFFLACVAGYFLGLLCWPYALLNPFKNPFLAFSQFSNFTGAASPVLFQGRLLMNTSLPWYYLPFWILISAPIAVLLGLLFSIPSILNFRRMNWGLALLLVAFWVPFLGVIFKKPILYDSWRHFFFLYPPLIVLSAWGWDRLITQASRFRAQGAAGVILVLLCLPVVFWMIRNHPLQTVYFNPLVGGPKGALGKFQMDYWGTSIRQASEWLGDYLIKKDPNRLYLIRADGNLMSSFPFLAQKLDRRYIPYEQVPRTLRPLQPPHYEIVLPKRTPYEAYQEGQWPPPHTIYEVKVDGNVPLCAVVEVPSKRQAQST